ncbi:MULTISPECIES: ParB/RepB/Spo0J family partition protein [unclassified Sphingomonas]|jgi:ParB family transcriptional regulator, chromosome partitioning protein|nr:MULTISPECIES: ParB/RepB/Spo0J family partition protein [unclassified Sphingomonas]
MTVTTVKFSQLRLSPLNVRKVEPKGIEQMATSILAHGIAQSLAVYEEGGKYMVFAGGRRLRGLDLLRKRKAIPATFPVPVIIKDKAEAVELSLIENEQRENMHPADAVRAYVALRDDGGLNAEDIAARFGHSTGHVAKLLRLGSLAPAVLDAFAADQIGMDAAKALTLSDDHAAQIEAMERCGNNPNAIRRALTAEKIETTSSVFLYVGEEAYQAAGGTITRTLFGDHGFADCPDILDELLCAKLDGIKAEFQTEGWHVVEVCEEAPSDIYNRGYLHPITREPTEAEAEALATIDAKIEELEQQGDSEELADLIDQREKIDEALTSYTDEQKATGGVCAYVGYRGELQTRYWRAVIEQEPEADATESGPYAASMIERLTGIRTLALQQAVAAQPDLALDILLDSLTAQFIHGQYSYTVGADIKPTRASINVEDELLSSSSIERVEPQLVERFGDIPADARFATIRAMEQADKMQLLAGLVAITLNGTVFDNGGTGSRQQSADEYAEAAGLDLGAVWTPSQPFFDRLKRTALLTILADECGDQAAADCEKKKKGDLAVIVNERLPAGWLPEPARRFAPVAEQPTDEGEMSEVA